MKKTLTLFIAVIFVASAFSQSQEVKTKDGRIVILKSDKTWEYSKEKVSSNEIDLEPEYSLRPYYVNNSELISFEKVKAKIDIKVKALGYGGSNTYLTAFGLNSNIRFKKGEIPKILIKIEGDDEPEDYLTILKSEKSKKKTDRRRFKQASMALGGKTRDVSDNEINFSLKKLGNNIYELKIDEDIEFGKYAVIPNIQSNGNSILSYNSTQKIYCFDIIKAPNKI